MNKFPGVWDTGEVRVKCEMQVSASKSFFDHSLFFFILQTIATAFQATNYQKSVEIYYLLYKYIWLIFLKNV